MTKCFDTASQRYLTWLADQALPLFAGPGLDPLGGVFEALSAEGQPVPGAPKRLRVQARQAFAFARAEALGLLNEGKGASDHAWAFLLDHGLQPEEQGGQRSFVHVLHADGSVMDPARDFYDHAFVLLAAAERGLRYGDPAADETAAHVWKFLDRLSHPAGGYRETLEGAGPRRQNPHMHLLEASLLCQTWQPTARSVADIKAMSALFDEHFWDAERGVLHEFFSDDWQVDAAAGHIIEPGHMTEWVWLLHQAQAASAGKLQTLLLSAQRYGLHRDAFILANQHDLSTGETGTRCRLWPQTEHIRALVTLAEVTGDEQWLAQAAQGLEALHRLFIEPAAPGCFHDEVDRTGAPLSIHVPASIIYHHITLADALLRFQQPDLP
ncbi:MAG: AGE family epimerase/isomerase [Pseudomonadota bacterium]